jgi:hypothetical protein
VLAGAAAACAAAFYLAQFMTMAEFDVDGGLILGYVHQVAHGDRPYFDFVDAYGPLNWVIPARAYAWSGDHVWGIRVSLLLLKLISISLTFLLTLRLSSLLYAALASVWMTILLGVPWPYAQTAYGFHQALPLTLATWLFLLVQPLRRRSWSIAAAGAATMLVIWIKLNTGMFLFAAGLLYCFCWMPPEPDDAATDEGWQNPFRVARWLGVAAYGLVFGLFMREHFGFLYLLYLGIPLALVLAAAAIEAGAARRRGAPVGAPLRAWAIYLGTVLGLSAVYVGWYFGAEDAVHYVRELSAILSSLDYAAPFQPPGGLGMHVGLNEFLWLQLPWAVTLAFAAWWLLRGRQPGAERSALHGLWIFVALGSFVLYSRSDPMHVYQALVPAVPALFIYLARLEAVASERWGRAFELRSAITVAALAYGSTLAVAPSFDALRWSDGDWTHESLRHIEFRPTVDPYTRGRAAPGRIRSRDVALDEAAQYIDSITEDGTEVLVTMPNELLNFISNTRPAGGRYKYLFYLAKVDLLPPEAFNALVPRQIIDELIADPPPVIVVGFGVTNMLTSIPELAVLFDRYRMTRHFKYMAVMEPVAGSEPGSPDPSAENAN